MSANQLKGNIFELQPLEIRRLLTTASVDGSNTLQIVGTSSGEDITVNRNSSLKLTVTGVGTTFTIGSSAGQVNKIFIQAGGGNDTVLLTNNVRFPSNNAGIPATIAGNAGNDSITSGPGNDVLSGNDGDDMLDGGVGNDLMTGGANIDTSNYSTRSTAIRVTINNNADADGELSISENDQVETEEVLGGAGNDTLTGSNLQDFLGGGAGADSLTGNDGNDELIGSTGQDKLFGNNGDDYLHALNNDVDTVNGGTNSDGTTDFDAASVDTIDVGSRPPGFAPTEAPPLGSDIDTEYGVNDDGKAKEPIPGFISVAASAIDAQGNVYYAGTTDSAGYDFVVARLDPDGVFDSSFNGNTGQTVIDFTLLDGVGFGYGYSTDFAGGIAIAPDGKIIVVGSHQNVETGEKVFAVARLLTSGSLDPSFNTSGTQIVNIQGSIGTGYGDNAVDAVVEQGNKVVVVGSYDDGFGGDFAVARLTNAGAVDTTFNTVGYKTINVGSGYGQEFATSVALQTISGDPFSQYIVVGGVSDDQFAIARLRTNGVEETSFTVDLGGTAAFLADLAVNSSNQIIAVGNISDFSIGRPEEPDIQPVSAGEQDGMVAVFSATGTLQTYTDRAPTIGSYLAYDAVHIDSNNRIVVAGEQDNDFVVARYLPALTFDPTFADGLVTVDFSDPDNETNEQDFPLAARTLSDGKILVSGLNLPYVEAPGNFVAVRFKGNSNVPPNIEGEVTGIKDFIDYDGIHDIPPAPPLDEHFTHMSDIAKFYLLSQPDGDGVARIILNDRNNIVILSNIVAQDGQANVIVNVDGLAIPYATGTTTRIEIYTMGGDDIVTGCDVAVPLLLDGGIGNDALVGSAVADIIKGGPGNDMLVGCNGADQLNGDSGEDILIGGNTSYDENIIALMAIMDEWKKTPPNQSSKVSHLTNTGVGGANNPYKLKAGTTVFDDAAIDILTGGANSDWFFRKASGPNADVITDTPELVYVI